jgi:hypothetical protein
VIDVLMVEPLGCAISESRVMAIGLHHRDRHLTRSDSPSMFAFKQIPSLFRVAASGEAGIGLTPWSITGQLPIRRGSEAVAGDECSCGVALSGDTAVYNEEAFRFLLDIERRRFDASSQLFVLVLVELTRRVAHPEQIPAPIASKIFDSLTRTLRDTDLVGWYRDQRVIGAVLTHVGETPLAESTRQMSTRVTQALASDLPEDTAKQLKVRLYRPRAKVAR